MGTFGLGGLNRKGTWLYPIASAALLPPTAVDGTVVIALNSNIAYQYDASVPGWTILAAGSTGIVAEGEVIFGGSRLAFAGTGSIAASEIQYARVFLVAGLTFDRARVFVSSGALPTRHIELGLYSQADPANANGVPTTQIAVTAQAGTILGDNTLPFTAPYFVTTTGYYWIAFVCDSSSVKFAITSSTYAADFLPVRREATTGTTLPATVGVITNPISAVAYVSVLETTA